MNTPRIVVLGGGESGTGAAVLARTRGFDTFLSDTGILAPKYREVLLHHDITFEEGKHTPEKILNADEIIKSPGIPENAPLVSAARQKGIPVISELEFAWRFTNARLICVTGSNGKTTTTTLIWHLLNKAGFNVGLAGNIGQSFALQVATCNYDYYVLEVSSFQLDGMFDFKADVAVLTNITPNHLDRYDNQFNLYAESKMRIVRNQTEKDTFIWNADDKVTCEMLKNRDIRAKKIPFTLGNRIGKEGAWIEDNNLIINIEEDIFSMKIEALALQGRHNTSNSMAAGVVAKVEQIRKPVIKEGLSDITAIEHRMEFVANVHGIAFINDSKATSVNAVWYALENIHQPVVWICGGRDKGNDYSSLTELVSKKVKAIVCLGVDNSKIKASFGELVETIEEYTTAQEAVVAAYNLAEKGDTVLLSPACSSFDLFDNYEDRGRQFKQAVKRL